MNDFQGQLRLRGEEPLIVNESNVLLRGCQLRNTEWVLGLVIACGTETKINFSSKVTAEEQKLGKLMQQVTAILVARNAAGCRLWAYASGLATGD